MSLDVYEKIMTLAKRRGYIYPSFEIYGGIAGFFDYGPLGCLLKNNVENIWRKYYLLRDTCIEINTPTITLHEVLSASGHVDEFTDLTVDCIQCKRSYKAEDIVPDGYAIESAISKGELRCPTCGIKLEKPYPVNLMFSTAIGLGDSRKAFLRPETAQGIFTNFHFLYRFKREKLPFGVIQVGRGYRNEISPRQGVLRQREFSMAEAEVFFDPLDKTHPDFHEIKDKTIKLFDNDIEYRITLDDAVHKQHINNQALAYYMYLTQEFLFSTGINPDKFRFRKHGPTELAHYATECWDAELYSDRFGWVECVGIADRSAYDLNAHIASTKVDMYALRKFEKPKEMKIKKIIPKMGALGPLFKDKAAIIKEKLEQIQNPDDSPVSLTINGVQYDIPPSCYEITEIHEKQSGEKFVPHVIEPSYGIDRIIYFILEHNYFEEKKNDEEYRVLRLKPAIAPIKAGVFPLVNDDKLIELAKKIDTMLRHHGIMSSYDDGGTIGRRYARMDEIGTPFCITIDFDTVNDNAITIRERDTTNQERIPIQKLLHHLQKKLE